MKTKTWMIVFSIFFVTSCGLMYTKEQCEASGGVWAADVCNRQGGINSGALLFMQGLQTTPTYQYQPLPVPRLNQFGTTCFNNLAGGQIITQCY